MKLLIKECVCVFAVDEDDAEKKDPSGWGG